MTCQRCGQPAHVNYFAIEGFVDLILCEACNEAMDGEEKAALCFSIRPDLPTRDEFLKKVTARLRIKRMPC